MMNLLKINGYVAIHHWLESAPETQIRSLLFGSVLGSQVESGLSVVQWDRICTRFIQTATVFWFTSEVREVRGVFSWAHPALSEHSDFELELRPAHLHNVLIHWCKWTCSHFSPRVNSAINRFHHFVRSAQKMKSRAGWTVIRCSLCPDSRRQNKLHRISTLVLQSVFDLTQFVFTLPPTLFSWHRCR